jgi:hypothetical protein
LAAYDCDFNFEPCNKNGSKAHWALVTGFLVPNITSTEPSDPENNEPSTRFLSTQEQLNQDTLNRLLADYMHERSLANKIYVLCKHGKSKHSGVWTFASLIESNMQLNSVNEEKCKVDEFVRPLDGDIRRGLASKVLIFN